LSLTPKFPYVLGTWPNIYETGKSRAIIKAWNKLNNSVWDIPTFLGELHETIAMLRHPFQNLSSWIKTNKKFAVKNSAWKSGQSFVQFMVDNWLQYRYGIRPLIKDIQDAIKAFQDKYVFLGDQLSRKGAVDVYSSTSVSSIAGSFSTLNFTVGVQTNLDVSTHVTLYYHQRLLNITEILSQRFGLSLTDIPGVAWELTRLSFVLDWFYGVGQWLTAIKPNPRIDYLGNCVSQVLSETRTYTVENPNSAGSPATVITPAKYVWSSKSLIRQVNQPVPVLPAYNPNFFKVERLVDGLALSWQLILKDILKRK